MYTLHSKASITKIFEILVQFLEFAKLFSWEHHNTVIALPVKIDRHISSWKKRLDFETGRRVWIEP